jgi:hypothetical protein
MLAGTVRVVAMVLVVGLGVLGTAFVVGELMADPGGLQAVWLTTAWLLPMLVLAALALWWPDLAAPLMPALVAVAGVFLLVDATLHMVPRGVGPVPAVLVFALAVPSGLLGWHRPRLAGFSLVALSVLTLVANALVRHNAPFGTIFGGSSGVLVMPLLVIGALLVLAWLLERPAAQEEAPPSGRRHPVGTPRR